jgi:hypothetical protein
MYIQCLETYPVVSERGKKIHVPRSVAEVAIYRGEAVAAPRPNYGTPEWMAERAAADANRPLSAGDVNPSVDGVQWGVLDRDMSLYSIVRVIKRVGSDLTYYKTPPAEAPLSIHRQYHELARTEEGAARVAIEAAKAAQYAQHSAEKLGTLAVIYKG